MLVGILPQAAARDNDGGLGSCLAVLDPGPTPTSSEQVRKAQARSFLDQAADVQQRPEAFGEMLAIAWPSTRTRRRHEGKDKTMLG